MFVSAAVMNRIAKKNSVVLTPPLSFAQFTCNQIPGEWRDSICVFSPEGVTSSC